MTGMSPMPPSHAITWDRHELSVIAIAIRSRSGTLLLGTLAQ
jgi:hypothetical protein